MTEIERLNARIEDLLALAETQSALIDDHISKEAKLRAALIRCQNRRHRDYADDLIDDTDAGALDMESKP